MMAHYYIHKRWMRKKNLYMHIDIRWATITGISENLHTLYVCVHVIHWMWWTCMFFLFGCYIYEKLNSSMCKIQYHNLLQTIFFFLFWIHYKLTLSDKIFNEPYHKHGRWQYTVLFVKPTIAIITSTSSSSSTTTNENENENVNL